MLGPEKRLGCTDLWEHALSELAEGRECSGRSRADGGGRSCVWEEVNQSRAGAAPQARVHRDFYCPCNVPLKAGVRT